MAYYLAKERGADPVGCYQRYQDYLRAHQEQFPPGAFALATAEWWQNANDRQSPHDAWLEEVTFSEPTEGGHLDRRTAAIRVRLLNAYQDGFMELFYPRVFSYTMAALGCKRGLGDWRYDEFTLSPAGNIVHEIEWAGFPNTEGSRWIIESSDIEFRWMPK